MWRTCCFRNYDISSPHCASDICRGQKIAFLQAFTKLIGELSGIRHHQWQHESDALLPTAEDITKTKHYTTQDNFPSGRKLCFWNLGLYQNTRGVPPSPCTGFLLIYPVSFPLEGKRHHLQPPRQWQSEMLHFCLYRKTFRRGMKV